MKNKVIITLIASLLPFKIACADNLTDLSAEQTYVIKVSSEIPGKSVSFTGSNMIIGSTTTSYDQISGATTPFEIRGNAKLLGFMLHSSESGAGSTLKVEVLQKMEDGRMAVILSGDGHDIMGHKDKSSGYIVAN